MSSCLTKPDRSTSSETLIPQQALDPTLGLIQPVDQLFWPCPLLLRDVEVHHILGDIFEVAKLL
jgi:hypothetical protein